MQIVGLSGCTLLPSAVLTYAQSNMESKNIAMSV